MSGRRLSQSPFGRIGENLGTCAEIRYAGDASALFAWSAPLFGTLSDAQWRHLTETSLRQLPDGRLEMRYDPRIAESFPACHGR